MFMLGGTGFLGHEAVVQAVQAGWHVKTLMRSEGGENLLQQIERFAPEVAPGVREEVAKGLESEENNGAIHVPWKRLLAPCSLRLEMALAFRRAPCFSSWEEVWR